MYDGFVFGLLGFASYNYYAVITFLSFMTNTRAVYHVLYV